MEHDEASSRQYCTEQISKPSPRFTSGYLHHALSFYKGSFVTVW